MTSINSDKRLQPNTRPVRVLVVGGGPAGLFFATTLKTYLGTAANIVVREKNWIQLGDAVRWKTPAENVHRRDLIVTLHSSPLHYLPPSVLDSVMPPGTYSYVWPLGADSPSHLGFPRNVRVREIEDRLLYHARQLGVGFDPMGVDPVDLETEIDSVDWDLIAVADGAHSETRDHFLPCFGPSDSTPFILDPEVGPVSTIILRLRVRSHMRDPDAVVLNVAQNRFLLNTSSGDGHLYMRLTPREVSELKVRKKDGEYIEYCSSNNNWTFRLNANRIPVCIESGNEFAPALDDASILWPRVHEGLQIFHCELIGLSVLRNKLSSRARFISDLSEIGAPQPVFGALLGDAAWPSLVWGGRGMNDAIRSSIALARCVASTWTGRPFRAADFSLFAASMSAIQHRSHDRGWRGMAVRYGGEIMPLPAIIEQTIEADPPEDRMELLENFMTRVSALSARLSTRLQLAPSENAILKHLDSCASAETLSVFLEAGGWETRLSGGDEVNINRIFPAPGPEGYDTLKYPFTGGLPPAGLTSLTSGMTDITFEQRSSDAGGGDKDGTSMQASRDVLGDQSLRESFNIATKYCQSSTLAWTEAAREMRALLIRADAGRDISDDTIADAIEAADEDDSDRIDADEFVIAMHTVLHKSETKVERLGEEWRKKFANAADNSGMVDSRMAARIVFNLAGRGNPVRAELVDKQKLRVIFERRCGNDSKLVSNGLFLEVSAMVMFGS